MNNSVSVSVSYSSDNGDMALKLLIFHVTNVFLKIFYWFATARCHKADHVKGVEYNIPL